DHVHVVGWTDRVFFGVTGPRASREGPHAERGLALHAAMLQVLELGADEASASESRLAYRSGWVSVSAHVAEAGQALEQAKGLVAQGLVAQGVPEHAIKIESKTLRTALKSYALAGTRVGIDLTGPDLCRSSEGGPSVVAEDLTRVCEALGRTDVSLAWAWPGGPLRVWTDVAPGWRAWAWIASIT